MNAFRILPTDLSIWNRNEFLQFLVTHQGQDIVLDINKEGSCLSSNGIYHMIDLFDFKSVTIHTDNAVEAHDRYNIVLGPLRFRFFDVPVTTNFTELHYWNQRTVFGAFYNRALWHRMGIAATLEHDYKTISTLNFRYDPHNQDVRREFELQTLFEVDPASSAKFMSVYQNFPQQLEEQDGYTVGVSTSRHTHQLAKFYPDLLIDIVGESFVQGRTFYATEKTVRPMLLKKPFVVMGPKCFLIHLRQMGFRTFYEFWDEDYDGYEPNQKYTMILKLIDDLSKKSTGELEHMYRAMQPILDHNYNLLVNKNYTTTIDYVD
jgi:hypothetical protein